MDVLKAESDGEGDVECSVTVEHVVQKEEEGKIRRQYPPAPEQTSMIWFVSHFFIAERNTSTTPS